MEVSMTDKGWDVGYLSNVTRSLEKDLLEMEGTLDPVLRALEVGVDPHTEWGSGLTQRVRDAGECKRRAWLKIDELIQKLTDLQGRVATDSTGRTSRESYGEKTVRVVISGTLIEG